MRKRAMPTAIVPTLALALALNVMVLGPAVASAASYVPFRARVSETFTGGPCGQYQMCITAVGTGEATELGKVTESAFVTVDTNPADQVNGCAPETRTTTLTAANGDTITMAGAGFTRCPGSDVANDSYDITGGTGRFAGASGSGAEQNTHTFTGPGVGVATVIYGGDISSPGPLER